MASKFDSLRAQCRARGECFKCVEKFSPGHKCLAQVQLHVLEELLEALHISDSLPEVASENDKSSTENDEALGPCWHYESPQHAAARGGEKAHHAYLD